MDRCRYTGGALAIAVVVVAVMTGCGGGGGAGTVARPEGYLVIPAQSQVLRDSAGRLTGRVVTSPAFVASADQEFALPVAINDAIGIAGISASLEFDSAALACVGAASGGVVVSAATVGNPCARRGAASLAVASPVPAPAGCGTIAVFRLKTLPTAPSGETAIRLALTLSGATGALIGTTADASEALARPLAASALVGDLGGTGNADVGAAVRMLRVVVGLDNAPAPADLWAWDCNRSGGVDVGDAIKVLRCVVSLDFWPIGTRDTAFTPPPGPPGM